MGIGPIRLFRSEDNGKTWEPLDGMLDFGDDVKKKWGVPPRLKGIEFPHVRHIYVHPEDQNLIWVLLEHGGNLLSRDRGKTWEDRSAGIDYVDMHYIENYPGSKDRYYVSSARGFYRSDDAGKQWRRVENGMPWGYTELYSYSHEWHFLPGETPRMVVCGGKGSPGVWGRKGYIRTAVSYLATTPVKIGASSRRAWKRKIPGCPGCWCTIRPTRTRFSAAWAMARAVTVSTRVSKARAGSTRAATAANRGSRSWPIHHRF
jgi:hypothetical protein